MQTELIEQIKHLPIAERIDIIEKNSRSVREDLNELDPHKTELSIEERKAIVDELRGIASVEGKNPPSDDEIRKDYTDSLAEKYK
ncbi:MAG: hypothetical protein KIS76_11725 [Pyrinomonadaceae bacterium]|nr:hypothetical protein [Pyrinomonadaceae bacterium]